MSGARPLANRVDPFGDLCAVASRGGLMGNRGGRFHNLDRSLGRRRWASRQWIACVCEFKARRREVWGPGYTELFFFDEPTAFAAGHRPCFECRRADALRFRDAIGGALPAAAIDLRLHGERLAGRHKRLHAGRFETLPDGAFVVVEGKAFAVEGDALRPWSFAGYGLPIPRPGGEAAVLTPPTILAAFRAGYRPRFGALRGEP